MAVGDARRAGQEETGGEREEGAKPRVQSCSRSSVSFPSRVRAIAASTISGYAIAATTIIVSGVYGLVLVILFVVLQAPDVALSMLVVAAIAYPLIVLAAIARTREGILTDEREQD